MRRYWKKSIVGLGCALLAGVAGTAGAAQGTSPRAPYALELAEYAVKVGPESARVVQTLRLTLYDDKWQTVPLGEAGSFIAPGLKGAGGRGAASDKGLGQHRR